MLLIEIEPDRPFGTLAQEVAEWQSKAVVWIPAAVVGLALGATAGWFAIGLYGAVLFGFIATVALAVITNNLVSGTRRIEYWGRAVDVAAGGDIDLLASQLSGYGQFRGAVPIETIKAEIISREERAVKWLARNRAALERVYSRRNGA
jgi:hypothetical protein